MSVLKAVLCPFHYRARPSGVTLESAELENGEDVGQNHDARIVILSNFGSICRIWEIFSSPKDSKVTPDGLALE